MLVLFIASCSKEDFTKEAPTTDKVYLKPFQVSMVDFYKNSKVSSNNTKIPVNSSGASSKQINTINYLKTKFPDYPIERDFNALSKKLSAAKIIMPDLGTSIKNAKKVTLSTLTKLIQINIPIMNNIKRLSTK